VERRDDGVRDTQDWDMGEEDATMGKPCQYCSKDATEGPGISAGFVISAGPTGTATSRSGKEETSGCAESV